MGFDLPYYIEPTGTSTKSIILLHGRGSQGAEFVADLKQGKNSQGKTIFDSLPSNIKWIFPSAHKRYSTVFQEEIDEWFDIYSLSNPNEQQELQKEGLKESVEWTLKHIESQIIQGIEPHNIILGGISQGLATAVHALLACEHRLGGFVGLSGWLPFSDEIERIASRDFEALKTFYKDTLDITAKTAESTLRTQVFISHAKDDNVVALELGQKAAKELRRLGMDVEWIEYEDGGHWINEPQGHDDLEKFLGR